MFSYKDDVEKWTMDPCPYQIRLDLRPQKKKEKKKKPSDVNDHLSTQHHNRQNASQAQETPK